MLCFSACSGKVKTNRSLDESRAELPVLYTWDVESVISDSGITRYRINAKEWIVYDKALEPYWLFPKGAYFEKFDENFNIVANVKADSVIYYKELQQWILAGNVKALNPDGEMFETDTLYVDQKQDRIHTDRQIRVTQNDKIIDGMGLESNQSLSRYTILNPTGIIPIEDKNRDSLDVTQ